MLIYVSGPMSQNGNGKTVKQNTKQGAEIACKLWEIGHAVICPHANTEPSYFVAPACGATYEQYVAGDLHMICYCDALVMTPDWKVSKGARIEYDYAVSLNIPIYVWPDYPLLHPTEIRCPEQVQAFRELIGKAYRTHLSKNADYSPSNILLTGELGLVTRIWDKAARLLSLSGFQFDITHAGTFTHPKQPKNEPIEDTLLDLMVYAIIGLLLRRNKWGK